MSFIFVGLGGAAGSMLRYAISLLPYGGEFPIWTLVTNCMGAVAIGFIAQMAVNRNLSDNTVLFLKTGVCGGFTTFSTFSLEAYQLLNKGMVAAGIIYALCSVIFCVAGIMLGMFLADLIEK